MPFVQRNFKGEIAGVYAVKQPGHAEEELAEDDADVAAFRAAHPVPPDVLRSRSRVELRQDVQNQKALGKEHHALHEAIWAFNHGFVELETALSTLLYEALHVSP